MAGNALAVTEVGGRIAVDSFWQTVNSPYLITESLSITDGATLSIEAGVTIYVAAGAHIEVRAGSLQVKGTHTAPVRITSHSVLEGRSGNPGDWGQIRFFSGTIGAKTQLENLIVEFGQGLSLTGASPTFNYVAINNHSAPAVSIDLASSPQGVGNSASGNTINGILVSSGVLQANARWGVRGIPYVLSQGRLSVGLEPSLSNATPGVLEQGEQASLILSGSRLKGLEKLRFEPPMPNASIQQGGNDSAVSVLIQVPTDMPVGSVGLSALTDAGEVALPNALSITAMQAPSLTGVTPKTVARNVETTVLLSGNSLSTAQVVSTTPGLTVVGSSATRTSLSFRVAIDARLAPAIYPLLLSNAAGQLTFSLEVIPDVAPPPPYSVAPPIVTLVPDSVYRSVVFRSALTSTEDRNYTLTIEDPTIARVRNGTLSLPAGQVSSSLSIAGLKIGSTVLRIDGSGLSSPLEVPVSVSSSSYQQAMISPAVGLIRGEAFTGSGTNRALVSKPVGLLVGNGNTTNVANHRVLSPGVGLVKGSPYGGSSLVVSPAVGLKRE